MNLYDMIQGASARAIEDLGKVQVWLANGSAWLLRKVNDEKLKQEVAVIEQADILNELNLLKATLAVKAHAVAAGGFGLQHGPALEMAADALYHGYDWEDEDIAFWFAGLVLNDDGSNDIEFVIEDEDD